MSSLNDYLNNRSSNRYASDKENSGSDASISALNDNNSVSVNEVSSSDGADNDNDNVLTKIFTIMMDAGENTHVNFNDEAFAESDAVEVKKVLDELCRVGLIILNEDIKNIKEKDPDVLVPLNPGSYYDDVMYEVAFYVNSRMQVRNNVSFGLAYDSSKKLTVALGDIVNFVQMVKDYFVNNDIPEGLGK